MTIMYKTILTTTFLLLTVVMLPFSLSANGVAVGTKGDVDATRAIAHDDCASRIQTDDVAFDGVARGSGVG